MTTPASILDRSDRYCIIGAGPAGLIAARSLKHAGIPYDQYEKNDDVGGIWEIQNDWSPMYESAHFISSKTISNLPGYPMPEDYPDYPNHRQILAYLKSFARHYDLYPMITFETAITWLSREADGHWCVELSDGRTLRYRGLYICNGNTWDPNMPTYPGEFTGEVIHSVKYKNRSIFEGKRVMVVGGGNSGCDIACNAAITADATFLSLRRGYHFIPKYILGVPSDKFADGMEFPLWFERLFFTLLLKLLVGDLTKYGLPKPDHRIMESHPIMNTQVLHYLGHGDLAYRPDIARFEGKKVHFTDGSVEEIDLIVYATGYKVTYPFMDRGHFEWVSKYPDLYLSGLHRTYDNVCCLGLHQTDGGAYDLFMLQADMMTNFILDQDAGSERARAFSERKRNDRPDLSGGLKYVKSARHATYVKKTAIKRYSERLMEEMGWTSFGTLPTGRGVGAHGHPSPRFGGDRTSGWRSAQRNTLRTMFA